MSWPFEGLRMFGYDVIVADPPWRFELRSSAGEAKSAQAHYDCIGLDRIMALPVGQLARRDCWLMLWATAPMLPQALAVMGAWGATYRSRLSWRKLTRHGKGRLGTGYIVRTLHEDVLIGAWGQPPRRRPLPSLFDGEAREHSRKPDEFYALIDQFAPATFRADLFGRQSRPGWDVWGNEARKFDAVGEAG
ncbi:MAG: hypothetical protein JNM13_15645 [Hyphomicrobiaceae bacterium]|nr:hypothetical protein [Hyphomicrobiaceae bacterium]